MYVYFCMFLYVTGYLNFPADK